MALRIALTALAPLGLPATLIWPAARQTVLEYTPMIHAAALTITASLVAIQRQRTP